MFVNIPISSQWVCNNLAGRKTNYWHLPCETKHALCHLMLCATMWSGAKSHVLWVKRRVHVSRMACLSVCLSAKCLRHSNRRTLGRTRCVLCSHCWTYCPGHKYLLVNFCPFVICYHLLPPIWGWAMRKVSASRWLGWQDQTDLTRQDIALSVQTCPLGQTRPVCAKVGLPSNTD